LEESGFAAFLRGCRGGKSKMQVERATRVKRQTLILAERGDRLVRVATLKRLMEYYGGDIDEAIKIMNEDRAARQIKEAKGNGR
jgi:transcriptional regulator with XRE-family HTH domain